MYIYVQANDTSVSRVSPMFPYLYHACIVLKVANVLACHGPVISLFVVSKPSVEELLGRHR